jgi:hypothetical protein
MPTTPDVEEWITVEEATDERLAAEVARRLRERGVAVRLVSADPSDPSRHHGELTVQVPLEAFDLALGALEELDGEAP